MRFPRRPGRPARSWSRRRTSAPSPTCGAEPRSRTPMACRSWWTRRGALISRSTSPARARARGGRRPGHVEHAQDRGQLHAVGDAPPRACLGGPHRRVRGRPRRHAGRVDQPELAAARLARRRAPPRRERRAGAAAETIRRAREMPAQAIREMPGLDVLDERIAGRPGVHGYDPLRLAVDVRGTGASGYQVAQLMHERGRRQPRAVPARP